MGLEKNYRQNLTSWALHASGFLAVALVLAVFYQLGYARLADQGEAYEQRADQLDQLLATSDAIQRKHQSLRQELNNLEQEAATMHRRLPPDLRKEQFEGAVRKAADEVGFDFQKFTWNMPNPTPSYSLAEVTVDGVGSFASICQFLSEINQLARITKISRLQLKSDPNSEGYPFQVTFVLVYGIQSNDTNRKGDVL